MAQTNAWLLNIGAYRLALAQYELIEVVSDVNIKTIPMGPKYCQKILIWRSQLLPLVDFSAQDSEIKYYIVVAWQLKPGEPLQYGSLALLTLPESIIVDDEWQMKPPTDLMNILKESTLSCFKYEGDPVIIPDLKVIYGASDGK